MRVHVLLACAVVVGGWFVPAASATSLPPVSAAATVLTVPTGEGGSSVRVCRNLLVPVALSAGLPATEQVFARLCLPRHHAAGTVQLLLHGGTYDHTYWDFPYQRPDYSYVDRQLAAGFATVAIDRIGVGRSTHPPAAQVTTQSNAYVVHQLVQDLKSGSVFGQDFNRVIEVGHSYGSITSWVEAGTYHDVDALIITGALHQLAPATLGRLGTAFEPASADPYLAREHLPAGYLTTAPGRRASLFYQSVDSDPAVLALDEATRHSVTIGELTDLSGTAYDAIVAQIGQIGVPVLDVVGQYDAIFCGAGAADCSTPTSVLTAEKPVYSAQACLQTATLPAAGHDLNLHLNAGNFFDLAARWAQQQQTFTATPTTPCPPPVTGGLPTTN